MEKEQMGKKIDEESGAAEVLRKFRERGKEEVVLETEKEERRRLRQWLVSYKEHEAEVRETEDELAYKKVLTWTVVVQDSNSGERYVSPNRIMNQHEVVTWATEVMTSEAKRQKLRDAAKKKPLIILPGG